MTCKWDSYIVIIFDNEELRIGTVCFVSEEGRGKGDGGRGGVEKSKKRGVIDGEDKEAAMRRKKQVRGEDRSIETFLFDFKRIEYSDHSRPWLLQGTVIFLY